MKNASRRIATCLAMLSIMFLAGCDGGDSSGSVDTSTADQAFSRGNGVVWVENKASDFWNVEHVVFSGTSMGPSGTDAGTYELAPGQYSVSVSCSADPWTDQWARTHNDTKASNAVGVNVVAGQTVHVVLDSTGAGNVFSLTVVQ